MSITTITSRELNQDVTKAKKATRLGPVFITDRGRLAQVLISFEEYKRLTKQHKSIVEALAMREDVVFNPPRVIIASQPADFC